VVELVTGTTDKGDAIDELRRRCGATATVYVGDDQTDEHVFARLGDGDLGVRVGAGETRASVRVPGQGDVVRSGLERVRWPGRLELMRREPELLLDAAHNPHGCARLADHLRTLPAPSGKRVLLFGALEGKDAHAMLERLDGLFDERVYALPEMRRAGDLAPLAGFRSGAVASSVTAGFALAEKLAGRDGRVVVAGSIFLMAAVRAMVLGLPADPPIAM
jgi:dihydrofolate synthase/folylpolyglutamate synthase